MKIIHLSDLHIGKAKKGRWSKFKGLFTNNIKYNKNRTRRLVSYITENEDPQEVVIVITGDIVDNGSQKEIDAALDELIYLKVEGFEIHVVPGNHDVGRLGLVYQKKAAQRFRELSRELSGLSSYPYTKEYLNFRLICLDSTCSSKNPMSMARGEIGNEQLAYLASRPSNKPTIVSMHHSPLGGNPSLWIRDRDQFLDVTNRDDMICLYGHLHTREHFFATQDRCEMIAQDASTESMSYRVIDPVERSVTSVKINS